MYTSSGIVVLDSYPLLKVDAEFLDSLMSSMEEGLLYVVISQGKGEYKSPFTFSQMSNWVSNVIDSKRIIMVDLPVIKDINDRASIILGLSNVLSNLAEFPHIEPLSELCCYSSSLRETNPYVINIKECIHEQVILGIEGIVNTFSRKELFDKLMLESDIEEYFSDLTPSSYNSLVNYKKSLVSNT